MDPKTLAEQLSDATANLSAEQSAHAVTKSTLEKATTDLSAASAETLKIKADLSAALAANDQLKIDNQALSDRAHSSEAQLATAKKTLIRAEKVLALDPDYIAITGRTAPVSDGSTGGEAPKSLTQAEHLEAYAALTDPKARADYRAKFAKELGLK